MASSSLLRTLSINLGYNLPYIFILLQNNIFQAYNKTNKVQFPNLAQFHFQIWRDFTKNLFLSIPMMNLSGG